jgi:hypothetical protein
MERFAPVRLADALETAIGVRSYEVAAVRR